MCSYDGELFNLDFSVYVLFPSYRDSEGYIRWTLRSLPYPRIHSAPVKDFYSNKIAGDSSVAADECTYKCKYCVLIYSNN